jgi:hypothetical protein
MRIEGSSISCGIHQLFNVGNNPTIQRYNKAIKNSYFGKCRFIIASLTEEQKKAKRFLLARGFKQVSPFLTNPNSGNKIALFMKDRYEKKKRAKVKK